MTLDTEIIAKILAPLLSLIVGAIIKHYSEARANVVSFIGHVSSFTLQDEKHTVVHTHSVVVRNSGRKAAHNVRLAHTVLPPNVTVYPPTQYTIQQNPEGASEIVIPILVPKEQLTISYLYFPPLTWNQVNASTKSDEGFAKILNVISMPQPHKAILWFLWGLVFIGASFVFYWLVKLAAYVI